jgi:phosphotransferase system enzyme I (PtsI)
MEIRRGIPVSPGVAIGPAFVLEAEDIRIPRRFIRPEEVASEVERFRRAVDVTEQEIRSFRDRVSEKVGAEVAGIFDAHLRLLRDPSLLAGVEELVREKNFTPEHSVSRVFNHYARRFQEMEDVYLQERISDLRDIERRLLRSLVGEKREELRSLREPVILVARDLTPSQTADLDRSRILGFATDGGGQTSHTAIVARALQMPAVVGLHTVTADVAGGDLLIIDGTRGLVIVGPDEEMLKEYRRRQVSEREHEEALAAEIQRVPSETRDGVAVRLLANIEFPEEIPVSLQYGAEGIGLYRTEFLYLAQMRAPTEDEHFAVYAKALALLEGRPLVIRTLDLGADKLPAEAGGFHERNPILGCRSLRLCFRNMHLFRTQLRAILRASAGGDLRILFPMVAAVEEFRQAKRVVSELMDELDREGIGYNREVKMGAMVEVPAAALTADTLAGEVDFLSIGTNDLIQFTLAVDRGNENVAALYNPAHPAVLKLLRMVLEAGERAGVEVAMCGEMSGDVQFTLLLLGLGLRVFSVAPALIPEVKRVVRAVALSEAQEVARTALSLSDPAEILAYLAGVTRRVAPDLS